MQIIPESFRLSEPDRSYNAINILYEEMISFLEKGDERSARQLCGGIKWVQNEGKGTFEYCTGVGKTRSAIRLIALLRRDQNVSQWREVVIVVPTINLREQWNNEIKRAGLSRRTKIVVINSIISMNLSCSLLILDELHRYAADTFSKVFESVKYEFILGLTATMKRIDGKHSILQDKCPIIDQISCTEARKQGYISLYREYNLGIEMTFEERENYRSWTEQYAAMINKFNNDFGSMKFCAVGNKPRYFPIENKWIEPHAVKVARSFGWRGNSPYQAAIIMQQNESKERGEKRNMWGNDTSNPYHPDKIVGYAINGMRLMRMMKDMIYNHPGKTSAVIDLCKSFELKTITFGERIDVAETIARSLGDNGLLYHSKIKGAVVDGKKVSAKNMKSRVIDTMINTNLPLIVCTANSLDQGTDIPSLELGISHSRTSSATTYNQRKGRVARTFLLPNGKWKEAIIIHVYLRDTKDVNWLSSSQRGTAGITWVDNIAELLELETTLFLPLLENE